jgi:hypothetical protein
VSQSFIYVCFPLASCPSHVPRPNGRRQSSNTHFTKMKTKMCLVKKLTDKQFLGCVSNIGFNDRTFRRDAELHADLHSFSMCRLGVFLNIYISAFTSKMHIKSVHENCTLNLHAFDCSRLGFFSRDFPFRESKLFAFPVSRGKQPGIQRNQMCLLLLKKHIQFRVVFL